jgi:hypothetical protein
MTPSTDGEQPIYDAADIPTDTDHLMSLDPLNLTPAGREVYLDGVIGYHRNLRAAKEKGVKIPRAKRGAIEGEAKPKLTLADLGLKLAAKPTVTRRV